MTLPASGAISFNAINVELGVAGTTNANINQASYRTLAGVPSGTISLSNFYGKSNRATLSYTYSASTQSASLNVTSISGYVSGKSDITITVNSGVYLWSGFTLTGGNSGDTVTLVNNGYIMGDGGNGGGVYFNSLVSAGAGQTALSLGFNTTVNNTNASAYIGGGGGGGGVASGGSFGTTAGGGAAGGGAGGYLFYIQCCAFNYVYGGAGGSIGNSGANGAPNTGGGGGRVFAGTGGTGGYGSVTAKGGSAGGGGGGGNNSSQAGGTGGSANNAGGAGGATFGSGGGGGWGASGGTGVNGGAGAAGGKAVALNGNTVTWTSGNTTRVYGSVA